MAKQMEIHPDHNDVINAAESTPRLAWESLHMIASVLIQVHTHTHAYSSVQPGKNNAKAVILWKMFCFKNLLICAFRGFSEMLQKIYINMLFLLKITAVNFCGLKLLSSKVK